MGHDIYLETEDGKDLCYVRYGAFTLRARQPLEVYALLDAQRYNGGPSGIGKRASYTRADIEKYYKRWVALKRAPPYNEQGPVATWTLTDGETMLCAAWDYVRERNDATVVKIEFF